MSFYYCYIGICRRMIKWNIFNIIITINTIWRSWRKYFKNRFCITVFPTSGANRFLTILSIRIYITTECKVNASIHNEFIAIQRYRIYP